jgi:NADH-quinone oxidoreductase subunit J
MSNPHHILAFATLLAALGIWLMLPRGTSRGRGIGVITAVAALGLAASQMPGLGNWLADSVFIVLASVAIISAAAAVTFHNPLYCAIWFGQSILATAGLFFFTGAQFLAVATVAVYAGAILVTFLFLLMLAKPEGRADYDRVSWEAMISASTGVVIVGILSMTIGGVFFTPQNEKNSSHTMAHPITSPTQEALIANVLTPRHVAQLGGELFGQHLLAVETTGLLLLVAMIGATAIVSHRKHDASKRDTSHDP